MNHVKTGVIIFVLGFVLIGIFNGIWGNGSDDSVYYSILISILYLSAVVGGAASAILEELRERDS